MIKPLGQAWGVKYTDGKQKQVEPQSKALPDDLPVEEVLKRLGGKNTLVRNHG